MDNLIHVETFCWYAAGVLSILLLGFIIGYARGYFRAKRKFIKKEVSNG